MNFFGIITESMTGLSCGFRRGLDRVVNFGFGTIGAGIRLVVLMGIDEEVICFRWLAEVWATAFAFGGPLIDGLRSDEVFAKCIPGGV
jgi:hypothetical protein